MSVTLGRDALAWEALRIPGSTGTPWAMASEGCLDDDTGVRGGPEPAAITLETFARIIPEA